MAKSLFMVLFTFILCLSFSSAQITLTSPESKYSLGDEIKTSLSVVESSGVDGIISIVLSCDSYEIPFFATSVKLNANEQKSFTIEPLKLSVPGICSLKASLKKVNEVIDTYDSADFEISSNISLSIQINKKYFLPGEKLEIAGNAQKADGLPYSGEAILNFDGVEHTINAKGKFAFGMALDNQIKSGEHPLFIMINDSYGNLGVYQETISVSAVPTSIGIIMNKERFMPSDRLSADIMIYDQAMDIINESISATLYNPWGNEVKTEMINGQKFEYEFEKDAMPGNWWIYSFSNGIKERKFFYIDEYEKIDAEVINDTLRIKNSGNVAYQKPMQIIFSSGEASETQTVNLDIPVNKEASLKLNAPDGDYNITIKSDKMDESFNAILTGKAISVKSYGGIRDYAKDIAVGAFILIVIAFAFISRYKIKNKGIEVKLSSRA